MRVDVACQHFLADTGLAADEYRAVARRHSARELEQTARALGTDHIVGLHVGTCGRAVDDGIAVVRCRNLLARHVLFCFHVLTICRASMRVPLEEGASSIPEVCAALARLRS